jgi:hypothetical protein
MREDISETYTTHGKDEKCENILVGKLEGKRPHGKYRRKWEDNIKLDLREIEWKDED